MKVAIIEQKTFHFPAALVSCKIINGYPTPNMLCCAETKAELELKAAANGWEVTSEEELFGNALRKFQKTVNLMHLKLEFYKAIGKEDYRLEEDKYIIEQLYEH